MTDGILLAELQHDRMLSAYDTLIIDEAHERSLNIDFILGYLRQLLPKRPDLKVVITSATIDPQRFSAHFVTDAPDRRGVRADVPRRDPVPPAGRGDLRRRGGRAGRPRPDRGDRRRGQGAGPRRGPATSWSSCPASGRSATPRTCCRSSPTRPTDAFDVVPLVRPAVLGRAAQGLRAAQPPPGGAGHQRRRDLADRAGHPVRRRRRSRPDLAVLPAHEGAAAPHRAGQPGVGQPAVRALRPRRGGHRDPALQRGGLRVPPRVHRPGDPAHQPGVGDPADDRPRARRRRALPVRRPAGPPQRDGRCAAAGGARCAGLDKLDREAARPRRTAGTGSPSWAASSSRCRSTRGWPGWWSRPTAGAACARCW